MSYKRYRHYNHYRPHVRHHWIDYDDYLPPYRYLYTPPSFYYYPPSYFYNPYIDTPGELITYYDALRNKY